MRKVFIIQNKDVKRVLMGVPRGHKHYRCAIELEDGKVLIFYEATVANIVRAYITMKTHPQKQAIELYCKELKNKKQGFATYQLIETEKSENEILKELEELLDKLAVQ